MVQEVTGRDSPSAWSRTGPPYCPRLAAISPMPSERALRASHAIGGAPCAGELATRYSHEKSGLFWIECQGVPVYTSDRSQPSTAGEEEKLPTHLTVSAGSGHRRAYRHRARGALCRVDWDQQLRASTVYFRPQSLRGSKHPRILTLEVSMTRRQTRMFFVAGARRTWRSFSG